MGFANRSTAHSISIDVISIDVQAISRFKPQSRILSAIERFFAKYRCGRVDFGPEVGPCP